MTNKPQNLLHPVEPAISRMGRATKWATASNIANEGVLALVTFTLAALLRPEQFGMVAMAYLFILFIEVLLGCGFSTALIHRQDLQEQQLTSVFWLNVATASAFSAVAILLSGWWSRANHAPELQPLIIALSALVPVQGLCIVQAALLQRQMDFRHLAIRNISGTAAGAVAGIGLAVAGFGAWALVGQHLVRESVSAALLWRFSLWRPSLSFDFSTIRSLSGYSWRVLVGQIGVFFQNQTESLIMGLFFGPIAVGLYRFADRLVEMTLKLFPRAVQVVSLAHFSRLQGDLHELNRDFLRFCHFVCIATVPMLALLAGMADFVMASFGLYWLPAAPVLRILTLVGLSKVIVMLVGPLLQSLSRPGTHSLNVWAFSLVNATGLIAVSKFFNDASAGEQVVAVAATRAVIFLFGFTPLLLAQARRASGLSLCSLWRRVLPPLACGVIITGLLLILQPLFIALFAKRALLGLVTSAILSAAVWSVAARLIDQEGYALLRQSFSRLRPTVQQTHKHSVVVQT